jgi:hypothetical protein
MKPKFIDENWLNLAPLFLFPSMVLLSPPVKAQNTELPSAVHKESGLKDSVKESNNDFKQLIDVLSRIGEEGNFSEYLSPAIGLVGTVPVKGIDFTTPTSTGKIYKECSIVYAPDSTTGGKRPLCVYINKKIVTGHESESYWYRIDLQGRLEKVSLLQGKYDDSGKPIQGSGVSIQKDISSSDIQKQFKTEFRYWTKEWLKQQKAAIKSTTK